MFRKKVFWIILIVVILAAAGAAYAYYDTVHLPAQEADEEPPLQTTTVRQGDITVSATGAGAVIPAKQVVLGFDTTGVLTELLVGVGDEVQEGDVLARLDNTEALQALANAELQLAQAAIQTDPEATQSGTSMNAISLEQAEINLETAQVALDKLLNWEPDEDEIALAEANLAAAQASLNAAASQDAASGNSVTLARISLEQAEREMANAQENYDNAWDEARDWETYWNKPICDPGEREPCTGQTWQQRIERDRESTANSLIRAQDNLTIAQANYNSAVLGVNNSSTTGAESNVLNAELALKTAQSGATDDEIEAARIAVRQAELALQQAMLGREADEINLTQAQLNLEAAQAALEDTVLTAPMDGTVMSIAAEVGENVGTAAFITMADLEQPILEVFLDETDLDKVGVDFEAEVIFDALPDEIFIGHVVQVDPMLSDVGGVSAVRAVLQLDADSFAKPQLLPVGLNATVEVIGGRAQNALLVPVEALREVSPGEFAVFVMEGGEPRLRLVEVGLMDFTFAEILSGLDAGEVVTTGLVGTN